MTVNSAMTSDPVTEAVLSAPRNGKGCDEGIIDEDCWENGKRPHASAEPCTDQTDEYLCIESPRQARDSSGCAENGNCAGADQGGVRETAVAGLDGHACTDTWNCPKNPPCYALPASDLEEVVLA